MTDQRLLALALLAASHTTHADSLALGVSADPAPVAPVLTADRHRVLPDVTVNLTIDASCAQGRGLVAVGVADTRTRYALQDPGETLSVSLEIPAAQLPPMPVPEEFCLANDDATETTTVRAAIGIHSTLRCVDEQSETETLTTKHVVADLSLRCDRPQEPAADSSAARNSSVRSQVSRDSSGS